MTTTVGITLDGVCAGQNHAHISVAVNGGAARQLTVEADDLMAPVTLEEGKEALMTILRYHFRGRTKLQIKNELEAGIALVI